MWDACRWWNSQKRKIFWMCFWNMKFWNFVDLVLIGENFCELKLWISCQKTKYQPTTDTLRDYQLSLNLWYHLFWRYHRCWQRFPCRVPELLLCSLNSVLSQSERGYAGLAAVERSNPAFGLSIRSLNCQFDTAVSRKPEFKKAISQGDDGLIDKDISVLVSGFYIKLHLGQFPLTGGHIMNRSIMRPVYVRSHSDQ